MKKISKKGITPMVGVLLMVGLTVGLFAGFTYISGQMAEDQEGDIEVPNVDSGIDDGIIEARLYEDSTASEVWIEGPDGDMNHIENVGEKHELSVAEDQLGEYNILAYDEETGDRTLVDSVVADEVPEDGVEDLILRFIPGSADTTGSTTSGGGAPGPGSEGEGVSFLVENTADFSIDIIGFHVSEENENIEVDSGTAPAHSPYEIEIESTGDGEDGHCGDPPGHDSLPLNTDFDFDECRASSIPAVASGEETLEVELNTIQFEDDPDRDIDYFGYTPVPEIADIQVELFGPQYQRLEIPFVFNMLIIPESIEDEDNFEYDIDVDEDHPEIDPEAGPETVLLLEGVEMMADIDGDDVDGLMNINLRDNVEVKGDINDVGTVTGGDNVVLQDVDEVTDVILGDRAVVENIDETRMGSVSLGSDSYIEDIDEVGGDVEIGSNSEAEDIDEVDGDVEIGSDSVVGNIDEVGGDVIFNDGVTVESVQGVEGDIICNGDVEIENEGSC